jgi:hypothetical protein
MDLIGGNIVQFDNDDLLVFSETFAKSGNDISLSLWDWHG